MVLLNFAIVVFLVGMAAIWSTYGLFSALVHLFVVIVAGALAFAVWEPAAQLLLGPVPPIAWTVGLLLPFVVLLAVLRVLLDKKAKANVQFPANVNRFGGGLVGIASGYLTAGIMVFGLSHLPLEGLLGYKPYKYTGAVQELEPGDGQLWPMLDVDRKAYAFFSKLSGGSMAPTFSEATLANARPDGVKLAALTGLHLEVSPNSAAAIRPGDVSLQWAKKAELSGEQVAALVRLALLDSLVKDGVKEELIPEEPEALDPWVRAQLPKLGASGQYATPLLENLVRATEPAVAEGEPAARLGVIVRKLFGAAIGNTMPTGVSATGEGAAPLLVIRTTWQAANKQAGTFDSDNKVRVPSTHVRLVVDRGGETVTVAPSSASQFNSLRNARLITPFSTLATMMIGSSQPVEIDWLFRLKPGDDPRYLLLRNTRFAVPEPVAAEPLDLARAIGAPWLKPTSAGAVFGSAVTSSRVGNTGIVVELSSKLPSRTSVNNASWSQRTSDNRAVKGGRGRATKATANAKLEYVYLSGGPVLRVTTTPEQARSIPGAAVSAARDVSQLIYLKQQGTGTQHYPFAFALDLGGGEQYVAVKDESDLVGFDRMAKLRDGLNLAPDDAKLYLYFQLDSGTTVTHVALSGNELPLDEPVTATESDYDPEDDD